MGEDERLIGVAVSPNGNSVYATVFVASDVVHFFRQAVGGGGGGGGGTGGGTGGGVGAAPTLSHLAFSRHGFAAGASGASATGGGAKGARVSYQLDGGATVLFEVRESVAGRRPGKGRRAPCVAPTKHNHTNPRCVRVISLGSFTQTGRVGANSFHFTGRVNHHKLAPGSYTLVATPSAAGKNGKTVSAGFQIHR